MKKKYSLFIGRWQCIPPHKGHMALIETALMEGKNALVAIRDTEKNESNPFSFVQRKRALKKAFKKWGERVKIIKIDDIEEVVYGRKVGYGIREVRLSKDLENISGTKIRKAQKEAGLWQ